MPKFRDLSGLQFGAVKVIGVANRLPSDNTKYWLCECRACGRTGFRMSSSNVGKAYSCGCLQRQINNKDLDEQLLLNDQQRSFLVGARVFFGILNKARLA